MFSYIPYNSSIFCIKFLGWTTYSIHMMYSAQLSVSSQVSTKFGTCTVVSLNGTLFEAKMFKFTLECTHFSSTNVPFRPTTVEMLSLVLL
jgi:hypothetical protein